MFRRLIMVREIKRFFYIIKRIYRNLKDWLPIILKDEHWDEEFLYKILLKKLELMEDLFRNKAYTADAEKVADEIKEVIEALERLIKNEYVSLEEFNKNMELAFDKEDESIKKDLEKAFDGMKNHIENWWD